MCFPSSIIYYFKKTNILLKGWLLSVKLEVIVKCVYSIIVFTGGNYTSKVTQFEILKKTYWRLLK